MKCGSRMHREKFSTIFLLMLQFLLFLSVNACTQEQPKKKAMEYKKLTPEEENVIVNKGTEMPFTGKYWNTFENGTYVCKRCGAPLYRSSDKFESDCGWPSFDDEIKGAVKRVPDADGMRTEIICANCGAHLGHVFTGEHLTKKDTRYCVNSISMDFIPAAKVPSTDTAYFAGGCFWGVEYYMQKAAGVKTVVSGYMGGHKDHPTYQEVCAGNTGHYETVEIVFDPSVISFESVAKLFFEIHDPTEWNHQGPDYGEQYRSAVFYRNEAQKETTEKLIGILKSKGFKVVTEVKPAGKFWKAEDYHQDYYEHKGGTPYCHGYTKRF
jgi:peptide methionine sulfoxide reductase msrA/msrB